MFKEILPNLLPYLAASFTESVAGVILAVTSIETLGLGSRRLPTLGTTVNNALEGSAVFRGMWWWWLPPIFVLAVIFVGFLLLTNGPRPGGQPPSARRVTVNNVLEVTGLEVTYLSRSTPLVAVQDVSFSVGRGELVGLVGESGCGKSTTINALLRLLPRAGKVTAGWPCSTAMPDLSTCCRPTRSDSEMFGGATSRSFLRER